MSAGRFNVGSALQRTVTETRYVLSAYHGVPQSPHPGDRDFHDVAVDEPAGRSARRADAAGCSGEDHVARFEGAALADPGNELGHREHELRRVGRLQNLAADARLDREPAGEIDLV